MFFFLPEKDSILEKDHKMLSSLFKKSTIMQLKTLEKPQDRQNITAIERYLLISCGSWRNAGNRETQGKLHTIYFQPKKKKLVPRKGEKFSPLALTDQNAEHRQCRARVMSSAQKEKDSNRSIANSN